MDLIWGPEFPHGWAKLENLGAATRGVMNAILRPSDYLTQIVGSGGKAVISTWKWEVPSLVVLPNEPEVDKADVVRRTVEVCATPALAERLRREVWEIPTMIPAVFFTFHVTLLFGPPRVPRSVSELFRHSVACRFLSGSLE